MGVCNIGDYRAHLVVTAPGGSAHVIPVQFFLDVASGKRSYTELENHNEVLRTILAEWLLQVTREDTS